MTNMDFYPQNFQQMEELMLCVMMPHAGCTHTRGWVCCWGKKNCQLRSSMSTLLLFFSPSSIRYGIDFVMRFVIHWMYIIG